MIEFINWQRPENTTLANISTALDITKSHCHSILKTLQEHGWLRFDESAKTYALHPGLLGSVSKLLGIPSIEIIRTEVSSLVSRIRFPCVLSQPMPDETFMLIDKFHDPLRIEVSLPIGFRYPKDASVQMRALLAWAPKAKVDTWFETWKPTQYTAATPMTKQTVLNELEQTRVRGYARSKGEFTDGLMAVALPVFNKNGEVEFIINCSAPLEMMGVVEAELSAAMVSTVRDIHLQTLARVPPGFPA
ncbi:hypothetical protein ASE37_24200 [Rhizobium sp. Root268]|nr:hypothetical protein ASC86_24435 [Rhizobium sp. Root1212]KRD28641.1 hypothetical protein ASE37_24200 [Rhizobium sp. Root268]